MFRRLLGENYAFTSPGPGNYKYIGSVTFPRVTNPCQTRKSVSQRRSSSAPSVVCRHPSRLCHGQSGLQPTSPIECGPRTVALDARAHHDLHHGVAAACATTTIVLWHLHSQLCAYRHKSNTLAAFLTYLCMPLVRSFGVSVRTACCGLATASCLSARLGTRTVREPLCDCTVLCVGRARTGHGCQSDNYYRCAGSCAVQATGWPTAAAVY